MYLIIDTSVSPCSASSRSVRYRLLLRSELLQDSYQVDSDDLAIRLLDLPQLHQKVPEPRFSDDFVWCKYSHAVKLRRRICICWQMTSDDLIFVETP